MTDAAAWAQGRIALITGATAGFGEALARRIVAGGGRVIATGRRAERLQALADAAPEGTILPRTMDLRDAASIAEALADLPAQFQAIDVLFNNAGLALGLARSPDVKLSDWETMIETNVMGLARITHAVLPGMVERNKGDIINMSSIAGDYPYPGGNIYGATKAFVRQFSLNLRADLLGTAVRVTSIEPGMCDTEFSLVRFGGDKAKADEVYAGMTPLSAEDIAGLAETVLRLPPHVNINSIEVMPVQQAFSAFAVSRQG